MNGEIITSAKPQIEMSFRIWKYFSTRMSFHCKKEEVKKKDFLMV